MSKFIHIHYIDGEQKEMLLNTNTIEFIRPHRADFIEVAGTYICLKGFSTPIYTTELFENLCARLLKLNGE